jgi:branched-chain amino acid transport system substrate-binding protein
MGKALRPLLGVGLLGIIIFLIAAAVVEDPKPRCEDPLGCVDIPAGESLRLGVIQSLSGKVANLGSDQLRGLELALESRHGKVLGHPVTLVVEDSGCRPEGGANAALRIVSDPRIVAIFGTTCSGAAAAAAEVMSQAGLCMMSGNNSAPYLTAIAGRKAPKWQPGFFRTAPNEEHSGPAAARYARLTLGAQRAGIIHDGDIYTKGLAEGFRREFERLGGKTVLFTAVDKGDADMRPVLEAVAAAKAELLFFPLFQPEGNNVLLAARNMPALSGLRFMSDGSLIEQSFIDAVGDAAKGMYFVGPTPPKPSQALASLTARYEARYGEAPHTAYYSNAYDAASVLLDAITRAGETDSNGHTVIGRQALRDALASTREYPGVVERLSCDKFGDCATPRFNVLRLDDPRAGVNGLLENVVFTYAPQAGHGD